MNMPPITAAVTMPRGFRCAGASCGIKSTGPDLGLLVADQPCAAACVATRNRFRAAPVVVTAEHIADGHLQALVVNSGNANSCTGQRGMDDARAMAAETARLLNLQPAAIAVGSTGIIGQVLPMDKIKAGIAVAANNLERGRDEAFARAIMTTDSQPKAACASLVCEGTTIHVGGVAKGAGMIHPDMATMLAYLTTDANADPQWLQQVLRRVADRTFNRLTVDGDSSTNDTVLLMASGASATPALQTQPQLAERFEAAVVEVCDNLARAMARDGEGATKLICVACSGAADSDSARDVARTVATSLLVKTAVFGCDPNWGRIAAAVGRSGVDFDPDQVQISINETPVFAQQMPLPCDVLRLSAQMREAATINIAVSLGNGPASANYYSCDLTYDYVKINAEYHT